MSHFFLKFYTEYMYWIKFCSSFLHPVGSFLHWWPTLRGDYFYSLNIAVASLLNVFSTFIQVIFLLLHQTLLTERCMSKFPNYCRSSLMAGTELPWVSKFSVHNTLQPWSNHWVNICWIELFSSQGWDNKPSPF
jgi:hypothetical protein